MSGSRCIWSHRHLCSDAPDVQWTVTYYAVDGRVVYAERTADPAALRRLQLLAHRFPFANLDVHIPAARYPEAQRRIQRMTAHHQGAAS